MPLIDVIGWVGAALLLFAYAAVSHKRLAPDGLGFQALNLGGSVMLLANAGYHGAIPSATVNFVWIGIALAAIAKARVRRRGVG